VTKAALYYHFRTKEDIVASLAQDRMAFVEGLIAWAREQPRTAETRREIIRRYAADMAMGHRHEFMRFMERNQTALRGHGKIERMRDLTAALLDLLCEPEDPLTVRLKRSMAIFAMHAVWFVFRSTDVSDEARTEAALSVALELVDSSDG
jgi:AcrR family transcriptional regulator